MGELILCRQSIAANPYFIEDGALNVYSLEELSYYIAHNVYLLNAEFASRNSVCGSAGNWGHVMRKSSYWIPYPIRHRCIFLSDRF